MVCVGHVATSCETFVYGSGVSGVAGKSTVKVAWNNLVCWGLGPG